MISVDDALTLLDAHRISPGSERVALDEALGRTLAKEITARVTLPPYAASAMDGYAVRFGDVGGVGDEFTVIGEAPAGHVFDGNVGRGEAVRIFTGGRVPDGADHIIIQENADRSGNSIRLTEAEEARRGPRHIRKAAVDFAQGDTLLSAGSVLGPGEVATAAAGDHADVEVMKEPRVAILANGDELRMPGSSPETGDIVASNYFGLGALVARWGGVPVNIGIAKDSVDAICERIVAAGDADVIVPVGGASVGDHDHMFAAFEKMGAKPLFRKIAVKPGKPTWLGKMGRQYVLGLPGNPSSAYVCAQIFLRTLLLGRHGLQWQTVRLAQDVPACGGRETFLRGCTQAMADSVTGLEILERQDSSLITPFLKADCLLRRPAHGLPIAAGQNVSVLKLTR